MTAQVLFNRMDVTDRFPMLGLTIRTDGSPVRAEIAVGTHWELFRSDRKAQRTPTNFYSSRAASPLLVPRGEAIYVVPPEVLARFVGQDRLYVALATTPERTGATPEVAVMPTEGSPYVSLKGLTGRSMKRVRLLPSRQQRNAGYGANGNNALEWAGDAAAPGMERVQTPKNAAMAPGPLPASKSPTSNQGNGERSAPPPNPVTYDDGFGPMPATTTPIAPVAGSPVPAKNDGEPKLTISQAYRGAGGPGGSSRRYSEPFLVEPYYQSSSWWDELTTQLAHFARGAMWFLGVTDTTKPPYSAICQVRSPDGTAEGAHMGTAFFIAPRLLLTAAHVVDGQSELIIVPGKNGAGTGGSSEPFGRFHVTQFQKHGSYGVNGSDNDMALIGVPAAKAASAPNYFDLVEELTQSRPEGVVVSGYAAWWYATSVIEEFVNQNIDENRQHAHGGHIRELPMDGTFSYDLQTLAGTSGSPVYWIEEGAQPRAHLVGVHVAAHDNKTNLGCRITQEKLRWIRATAAAWGQTLTFSLGVARGLESPVAPAAGQEDPDAIGIREDEPVDAALAAAAQALRARALDAPLSDYPGAGRFVPAHANNFTPRRRSDVAVDRIVIHITAGGPRIDGTIAWFQNGNRINERTGKPILSSAHYIVGRDGEVVQMVRNAHSAHHATGSNWRSIGIEHNANKPHHLNRQDLPPTAPQYEASARLVAWLCRQYTLPIDREHIVGHQEIAPGDNHDCPSSIWDWDHYMDLVRACASAADSQAQALAAPRRAWPRALDAQDAPKIEITQIAGSSEIARYSWQDRGVAPAGYIKGMALVYACVYSKLKAGDAAVLEMAKAKTADPDRDALTWYDDIFPAAGMSNDTAGVDTLRHLFVLLIGLGMRESSGKYCEGRDRSAQNTTAETAEAGLFQTSFNARHASPLLPTLFAQYSANPSGFLDVFQEGVLCSASNLENFGSGDGREFQRLSKECPAFAAEFAAVGLRNVRRHWGPITRRAAEVRPECDAMLRQVEACVDAAATFEGLSARAALGDESFTLNWDDLELIAQPTGVSCWSAAAAMIIGWRDRVSISPETIAEIAGRSLDQGINREYANVQAFAEMMGLMWAEPQSYSVDGFRRLLEANGPLWVTKEMAADIPNLHAVIVTGLYSDGTNTFVRVTDPWDRQIGVPGVPGAYLDTHATGSRYIMSWDQFMAEYEWLRYRDNQRPQGQQRDFLHILHAGGTGGRVPNYGPGTPPGYAMSLRRATTFGAQARPLSEQSFTLNWDDVQPIPQPTDVSCWAAAAAMVVGWKDLMSLSPETIAQIASRTTATGLDPAQVEQFAREIGIVFEYPQSYTVDGFRNLLEANGPLWVGAAVPGLHAIVVSGMYHDGTNTFVRITDPWDRQVGTPGAPGPYLQTHSTGSRYVMRWEDFVREYEAAATDYSRVNLQILHASGTDGRTPNHGTPVGYAQALRAARAPDRGVGMERYATTYSNHAASGGTSPAMIVGRRRETGSKNGTVWELDQLDGFKRPAGQNGDAAIGTGAERRVTLDDWPYVPAGDGETRLPLTVSWTYGNGTVGNIRINAGEPRSVPGWTHRVTADIADGPETAKIAAVRVVACHKFGSSGRPDIVAVTELTLFGDGTYQRQDRWEKTQAAAA